ncbi:MAG TPA: hypothetical protein VL856_21235 [Acidimicrobiia bacterium]|jgi:hypothetical protein|nr:hypothetical protein [Acidimicrobiia bacterium]
MNKERKDRTAPQSSRTKREDEDAAAARQRARERAGEEALPRKSGRTRGGS